MLGIQLEPLDTLFFRGSTPFTADSAPQDDVGSRFPPPPATMVGALRAAIARCNGWNGLGRWPRHLDETLGDGPNDLGALFFQGPFVLCSGEPLYQVPQHLLGFAEGGGWRPSVLLRPGAEVTCDLGVVRLPHLPDSPQGRELKAGQDRWVTRTGLEAILAGSPPPAAEVRSLNEILVEEPRTGLARNEDTRTAEDGMLYSTRHVRLRSGVSLGMRVGGIPAEWQLPLDQVVALGGESRTAESSTWDGDLGVDMPLEAIDRSGRLTLIALTPLDLERDVCLGRRPLSDLGGARVVCACVDRPLRIGGWDSLSRGPLPLRSVLAPGSVLFCEIDDPRDLRAVIEAAPGLPQVGARQQWGFGVVAFGVW